MFLLLACTGSEPVPEVSPEPVVASCEPTPVVHLAELEGEVSGPTPDVGVVGEWTPDAARWSQPVGRSDVAVVRMVVRKGTADVVKLVPVVNSDDPLRAGLRQLELDLERDAGPDDELTLEVDLRDVLRGSWGDTGDEPLDALQASVEGGSLRSIQLLSETAFYTEPAQVLRAVVDGKTRPTWAVSQGGSVRFEVDVTPGQQLRWHVDRVGLAFGVVKVDGEVQVPSPQGFYSVPLQPGKRVIELSSHEPGVSLFGDPRVLSDGAGCAPDVVLVLIDTLRRDALHLGNTPAMDQLADSGTEFVHAWSTSAWTKPAIASLHSAQMPTVHGIGAAGYTERMPTSVPLLQERFRDAGWRTGSFSSSPLGTSLSGLDRGFGLAVLPRHWDIGPLKHPTAVQVHDALFDWIEEEPDRPFFAYVHTLEPHQWHVEELYGGDGPKRQYARSTVDADVHFGDLMQRLTERGRPLIVGLVSDHGEAFKEHGVGGHGSDLHEEQVGIPFILWGEGVPAARIEAPANLVDMGPTLLDLLDLPPLVGDGVSLLPELEGTPVRQDMTAHLLRRLFHQGPQMHARVDRQRLKTLKEFSYDLATDPHEKSPTDASPQQLEAMAAALGRYAQDREAFLAQHGRPDGQLDDADLQALKALGYVE